jgi:hypothetical protein
MGATANPDFIAEILETVRRDGFLRPAPLSIGRKSKTELADRACVRKTRI